MNTATATRPLDASEGNLTITFTSGVPVLNQSAAAALLRMLEAADTRSDPQKGTSK